MILELLDRIEHEWRDSLLAQGIQIRPPLYAIKIGDPGSKSRKITMMIFNNHEGRPSLILKLAQTNEYGAFFSNEYKMLEYLRKNRNLKDFIPAPLGKYQIGNDLVILESVLPGVPLYALLQARKRRHQAAVRRDFNQALAFLSKLQMSTAAGCITLPFVTIVSEQLENLKVHYGPSAYSESFREKLLEIAVKYQSLEIVQCGRHGDYWPGNILVSPSGFNVIDWDAFTEPETPFFDAFFFLVTYVLNFPWFGWKECSQETAFSLGFIERGWFSRTASNALLEFFRPHNRQPDFIYLMFSLFLIEMALPLAVKNDPRQPPQYQQWYGYFVLFSQAHSNFLLDR